MADGTQPGAGESPRIQPHNLEAEHALLGAMLVSNEVFGQVENLLDPSHFYDPVHGRIYDVMARLIRKKALASPVTVKSFMAGDEGLDALGGADYLAQLATGVVSLRAAPDYAATIRELATRRALVRLGDDIQARAASFEVDDEPEHQISAAEQALYTLAETGRENRGFASFLEAATQAVRIAGAAKKRGGGLAGLSSGLRTLDDRLGGFRKSDLVILAARPSMGKTALALNLAYAVARQRLKATRRNPEAKDGGVVGFFSLEMSSEQLANRLLAAEARIKSHLLLTGELTAEEFHRFVDTARDLESLPLHIDDTPALPISTLAARARRLKRQKGLDMLVVDYLQLCRPAGGGRSDGRVQEVSEITQSLKAIAKELDIPVIALSQLSRKVEEREDKRPQLSDLRESGSIEQDADVVMFIFRESYYHDRQKPPEDDPRFADWQAVAERLHGRAEVIIGKQRHGPIGTAELMFHDSYTLFSDPPGNRDTAFRDGPGSSAGPARLPATAAAGPADGGGQNDGDDFE
ncbi:MAG: replicative DNA helicase [Pseudomonadota bacterium]